MDHRAASPSAYPANALPPGTRLGEFEVLRLLGVGGFGIVYLAFDHALEREVAVKEYMPAMLVGRTETLHVSLRSQSDAETFALGLNSFINEAKLLAKFDHPSLVKVYRFWQAHHTAYMAMPVYRGRTLRDVRHAMQGAPDEAWMRALMTPLLSALEVLHAAAVYHRDIAPDNIVIEPDGRPVLLDFGAARRVIGDKSQNLTAILKPQYAPIEQYADAGGARQGPWTDLYALGATLHFALVGRPPAPATARSLHDDVEPLSQRRLPGCGQQLLHTIDWMLALRPGDRPQSVAALRAVLDGGAEPPAPAPLPPAPPPSWQRTVLQAGAAQAEFEPTVREQRLAAPAAAPATAPAEPWRGGGGPRRTVPALAGLALALAAGAWWLWPTPPAPAFAAAPPAAASAPGAAVSAPASAPESAPPMPALAGPPAAVPATLPGTPARHAQATPATTQNPVRPSLDEPSRAEAQPAPTVIDRAPVFAPPQASVPRPAVAAAPPLSDDPSAICGKRVLVAQLICMERECRKDTLRAHPACLKWYRQNNAPQP
jgi:hypothetical protein